MLELGANLNGFSAEALEINQYLSSLFNGLAGQSLIFDNLIGLVLGNNLVKAGVIGLVFLPRGTRKKRYSKL